GAGLMVIMMAGMLSSAASQVLTTGKVNMGQVIKAGVVAVVTAGITQGALSALNVSSVGASTIGNNISTGNWAAAQSSLGSYLEGAVVHSAISAGVSTAAYGGSFGQAFANGMVQSAAALGANAIGAEIPGIGMANASASSIALNVASHALLGCAAQSMSGGTCEGGAIGGAASAVIAPLVRDALYSGSQTATTVDNGNGTLTQTTHYNNATFNAATTALAMLAGGGLASALGANAQSAADAAQNESVNNATAEHQRSLPANAGTGSATSLGELAGRFGRGVVGGLKGVFVEPFLQVRDIGAAGLSFGYNELMRGEKDPYWYPEMKSGVAEAYANGTSQGKLLLQSNPLTGVGVLSYDATTALAQGRYGDAAEMAGGFAAGTAVGAGVSRFGGYGLTFGDIGGPRYGSMASQRGSVNLRLVTPEDGVPSTEILSDVKGPYRGGPHSSTRLPVNDGLDSHHMPDRNADPRVSANEGPAIQMDPIDHAATSSNGRNGRAGAIYRAETARMISEGNYRDAMAREIWDARRAGAEQSGSWSKYNEAIGEMLDYSRLSGQLPTSPRRGR
ncbi:DUF637 domain-containing protein, partial [Ralstonia solanacearum]